MTAVHMQCHWDHGGRELELHGASGRFVFGLRAAAWLPQFQGLVLGTGHHHPSLASPAFLKWQPRAGITHYRGIGLSAPLLLYAENLHAWQGLG